MRSNPYCLACHSTIEPLAASMWGFHWVTERSASEMVTYHAERELDGPEELGVESDIAHRCANSMSDAFETFRTGCSAPAAAGLQYCREMAILVQALISCGLCV